MTTLAIVGAGASGLAAAYALRSSDVRVTLFEKSRGVCGRAATRGRHGARYDHGANYITPTSDRVRTLITGELPTEGLVDVDRPVWTFDADGTLHAPDEPSSSPKWTYRRGISTLGKRLADACDATIHHQVRIAELHRTSDAGWHLTDTDDTTHGPFDAVLLTPPAPQTASILRASRFDADAQSALLDGVEAATYVPQFACMFAVDGPLDLPGDAYGYRSIDGAHPLAWVGVENAKPGHVPRGTTLLVAQTSPEWTTPRVDRDPDEVCPEVQAAVESLLDVDLSPMAWTDTQRWRYALPVSGMDSAARITGERVGLFLAGDGVVGTGRVGRALESGFDAADRLRVRISAQ